MERVVRKVDKRALRADVVKQAGFAFVFAAVMVLTAWASWLPMAGH